MTALAADTVWPQDSDMAWTPRHDKLLYLAALAFGVLALPFLVYLTGTYVFGQYASGGALGFVGDFMRGLATFRWYAWSLALGPLAIVAVWRGLWRLAAPHAVATARGEP
jgi:MFS superfamily sulfate permease-like transporter